ncbi:heavy-metal-associated domain-containing protein [Bacillus sp. FJAT-45350]|uniref:heavy-metal-associated domain-containing protein n=1 Tax=Bacillus sp. FJAT-45350 TaxID=2011014 RepID=UPI000BB735FD|nr:heavy-metal-associated domain-containing protein [Bacillus sp. FJAT-45350]
MKTISLQVEKMSCGNCLTTVETAIKSVEGVNEAKGSLEEKTIKVQYNEEIADVSDFVEAVEEVGYIII